MSKNHKESWNTYVIQRKKDGMGLDVFSTPIRKVHLGHATHFSGRKYATDELANFVKLGLLGKGVKLEDFHVVRIRISQTTRYAAIKERES